MPISSSNELTLLVIDESFESDPDAFASYMRKLHGDLEEETIFSFEDDMIAYLGGDLAQRAAHRLDAHVKNCAECQQRVAKFDKPMSPKITALIEETLKSVI